MSIGWDDFDGPRHADELMSAHEGAPTIEVQDATHGTGLPDADNGMSDEAKYGSVPSAC